MVVASVAACSSGNVPSSVGINGGADFKGSNLNQIQFNKLVQNLNSQGEKPTIVDMGYKGGISFAVKINPAATGSSFSTKANEQGHRFVGSDVDQIKVFLFADDGFASGDPIAPEPTTVVTTLTRDGSSPMNVIFRNVPGNSDSWRVAVTSLTTDAALGGDPTPRNITKPVGTFGTYLSETYSVSTTGGDAISLNQGPGSLLINTTTVTFDPASTAALGIETTLIDADGAKIDSNTTVNNGSST
ncbi:MAG: hypothetical protein EOO43_24705, partial [Flavobacterium sp.]